MAYTIIPCPPCQEKTWGAEDNVPHSRKTTGGRRTADCPICAARRQGTTEIYLISEGEDRYFFNVEKAKAIVADGRPGIAIDEVTLRKIVALNDYSRAHLAHVDPAKAGIMLQRFGGLVLLDGVHRAVRCLAENKTFHACMLNYRESLACLIRQEIASADAPSIVAKLRKVLAAAPDSGPIEAEIECNSATLARVQTMLTPEERERFVLRTVLPGGDSPRHD